MSLRDITFIALHLGKLFQIVTKRNAKAFSLNAVVDVRRHRHEVIYFEYLGN